MPDVFNQIVENLDPIEPRGVKLDPSLCLPPVENRGDIRPNLPNIRISYFERERGIIDDLVSTGAYYLTEGIRSFDETLKHIPRKIAIGVLGLAASSSFLLGLAKIAAPAYQSVASNFLTSLESTQVLADEETPQERLAETRRQLPLEEQFTTEAILPRRRGVAKVEEYELDSDNEPLNDYEDLGSLVASNLPSNTNYTSAASAYLNTEGNTTKGFGDEIDSFLEDYQEIIDQGKTQHYALGKLAETSEIFSSRTKAKEAIYNGWRMGTVHLEQWDGSLVNPFEVTKRVRGLHESGNSYAKVAETLSKEYDMDISSSQVGRYNRGEISQKFFNSYWRSTA